jgi:PAS domain S-box-containing protein
MKDQYKTKKQLVEELEVLRNQLPQPKKRETKRKPAKEELRESEETFKALAENANDGILVAIGEGLQVYSNKKASEITGYSVTELLKSSIKDLVHPDELEKMMERYKKRLAGEPIPPQYETVIVRKGGKNLPIELTAAKTVWQGKPAVLVIIRDITERKQSEQILRESEEKYRNLVERANDGIVIGQDGILRYVNSRLAHMGGYTVEELTGAPIFDFFFPEERAKFIDRYKRRMAGEDVPTIYETRLKHKNGSRIEVEINAGVISYNGKPADLVLIRDITERKQAEQALRESEERMNSIFRAAPIGIGVVANRILLNVNNRVCEMTGYSREELIGSSARIVYPTQDDFDYVGTEKYRQIAEKGTGTVETRWIKKDGTIIDVLLSSTPIDPSDPSRGVTFTALDITQSKQAEKALRESEERFRLAFENANTGVCLVDLEGNLTRVNDKMCEIFGYTKEELERMTVNHIAHPEDTDKSPSFILKTLRGEIDRGTFEKRYFHKKGHVVTCQVSSSLVRSADGSPSYFISHVHDITDRKEAETQLERNLRESHLRFEISQALASAQTEEQVLDVLAEQSGLYPQAGADIMILERGEDDDRTLVSRRSSPFDSGLPKTPQDARFPASQFPLLNLITPVTLFASPDVHRDERVDERTRALASQEGWTSLAMIPITAGDNWLGVVVAVSKQEGYFDEEKQHLYQTLAEQGAVALRAVRLRAQIRDTQQRFQGLVETLSDWIWEVDQNGVYTYVSPKVRDLLGYEPEEVLGKTLFDLIPPEEAERVKSAFEWLQAAQKPIVVLEKTCRHKDGRLVVFETSGAPFFDAEDKLKGYRGVDRDVTEHRQTEEALRESELKYRTILESIDDGYFEVDLAGNIRFFNEAMCRIHGRSHDELMGLNNREFQSPETARRIYAIFNKVYRTGVPTRIVDYEVIRKDGSVAMVEESVLLLRNASGEPIGFYGVSRDRTEQKKAEEALRQSEEKYRTILEDIEEGYFEVDLTGRSTFVNDSMCRIHGYSREELLGMDNRRFVDKKNAKKAFEAFNQVYRTGEPGRLFDYEIIRKDGTKRQVEVFPSLRKDPSGKPIGFRGIVRDITERKQAEAKIERALHETRVRFEVSQALAGTQTEDEVLDALIQHAGLYPKAFVVIFTFDRSGSELAAIVRRQNPFESGLTSVVPVGGGLPVSRYTLFGRLSADQPFVSEDVWNDERIEPAGREVLGQTGAASFAMFPLSVGSEWMGLILAMAKSTNYFDEEKQQLFQTLAEQGAVAMHAAHLQEQIRESQRRFKGLVETLSDWIWEIDQNRVYTYVSPRVRELLGYEPEELVGKTPFDLMPPEEAKRVKAIFESLLAARQPLVALENTCRHKDGRLVVFETSGAPFFDADGQFKGYRGVDRDITERRHAEEALRQSEERYRTILEDIEEGYFEVDLSGRFTFANESMCRIHGYPREEFLGIDYHRLTDHENAKKAFEAFNRVYRTGEPGRLFNYEIIRKDGTKRQVEVFPSLRKDSSGRPIGFRGITRDVTERKHTEELLQKEKEISLSILENAPYGVALIDKRGQYIYINPEFTNITGYALQDIPTGTDWFRKAFPDPKDRERMIQFWKEDRSKGKMTNREFGIHCKDAKIREIEIRSTFLKDGRAVIVLRDVTEQKLAEERMESLQEQLRQSQKMEAIGRLAGGIAHDFNNLLTIIKGYSQLSLIELKEDTVLKRNIAHIHTATDRAADLVRQLLAFSRRQILEMKVWDLNIILINLHNMLRRLIGEDIELVTLLAEDLGRVKTDLGWIEQAIMNLVVNARDAMPSGGKLTIETGNADLDEAHVDGRVGVKPGRYVMLSVTDTGVGMTPEVRERLFEPFFSTKEKDKGTGLGLSTVYGIVKQSGGDIWVYSEPGKGSTFKIYVPRVDEPLEERREKVLGDELLRGSETILLVEDEEEVRKLAVRVLERQGYRVLAARDGDEALLICEQHKDPIHLMLTDVVMPVMNGHEVAKRLESLHPETKVLYMSGYTDNAIVLHGVLVEGVRYIQKPFTVDALTKKVREVLDQ